jgi:hypothetical protein
MFQTEVYKIKTHFVFSNFVFENLAIYKKMWKNIVERGRPQVTYGACPLHAVYLTLQILTLGLCKGHCFSTATMVARTHFTVALYVRRLSCSFFLCMSIIIPALNNVVKVRPFPQLYQLYRSIFIISPDDGRDSRPKHVAYMRSKLLSEYLCWCISRITVEDINELWVILNGKSYPCCNLFFVFLNCHSCYFNLLLPWKQNISLDTAAYMTG